VSVPTTGVPLASRMRTFQSFKPCWTAEGVADKIVKAAPAGPVLVSPGVNVATRGSFAHADGAGAGLEQAAKARSANASFIIRG
jgi:hypothetical protein